MNRLTTNKPVEEMGMYELAHNGCYMKDGYAWYRDFDTDIDARDFARKLMVAFGGWKSCEMYGADADNEIVDNDIFDDAMFDNLQYEPTTTIGLIALFYRNLWAMSDLHARLKAYEDAEEQEMLIRLPCKVGDTIYLVDFEEKTWDEATVNSIEIDTRDNRVLINSDYEVGTWSEDSYVFYSKEEAEQALAKMEKEND